MDDIKKIIPQVIKNLSERKISEQEKLQNIWKKLSEGKAAKHTVLSGIREGKLLVYVDSPAWLFQMSLQKKKILEKLQSELAEISDIIFKIGKVQ